MHAPLCERATHTLKCLCPPSPSQLDQMKYYQRLYGDAYVDLCECGLARMAEGSGGSLVGISSPGCTTQYNANLGYDMPGSGKCVMEYAMRLFALRCAGKPDT